MGEAMKLRKYQQQTPRCNTDQREREKCKHRLHDDGRSGLTLRLRHAGTMVLDCQPRRDPGVACSRFVRQFNLHTQSPPPSPPSPPPSQSPPPPESPSNPPPPPPPLDDCVCLRRYQRATTNAPMPNHTAKKMMSRFFMVWSSSLTQKLTDRRYENIREPECPRAN